MELAKECSKHGTEAKNIHLKSGRKDPLGKTTRKYNIKNLSLKTSSEYVNWFTKDTGTLMKGKKTH
jgi:hypothetical protein